MRAASPNEDTMPATEASLEALVETGILPGPVFHPGGLEISGELADMCAIGADSRVLDVACGTGETACFLAETLGCHVVGIDATRMQIQRAAQKKADRGLNVEFGQADAHELPFDKSVFDAVISEAVLCYFDIDRALKEMVRVVKPGGIVGTHDMCWQEDAPQSVKDQYAEIENERPETLRGWAERFHCAGLIDVQARDRSLLVRNWSKEYKQRMGIFRQLKIALQIVRRWGPGGIRRIQTSQRIWESRHTGYAIVVGLKPTAPTR